jgi:hypothetical protein
MLSRAVAVLSVVTLLPATLGATAPDPGHCTVVTGSGICLVSAADPARPGGPADPTRNRHRPVRPAVPTPVPTPRTSVDLSGGGFAGKFVDRFGRAAPGTNDVLAQRAIQLLRLPRPTMQLSVHDRAYVGVPLWLWVAGGQPNVGPLKATATAGAAQVTATARLARTVWAMGPPDAVVTCPGTGTPWSGGSGASPDCGYTYAQRSLPERTAGRGTWPVTVTSIWQVTWTGVEGGAPVVGTQDVALTVNRALPVGELQVLVTGSSR